MPHRFPSLLLAFALAASCCASVAQQPAAPSAWIDVPFVAQRGEGCGAASIAMVMQYWERQNGRSTRPEAGYTTIDRALYSRAAHGIYASAMERYFRKNGYQTFAFTGQTADLAQHLAKGRPLIAALEPGTGQPLHFVVVAGVDPARHLVLLNDPAQRKLLEEDQTRFEQEWKAAGNWTLLALPAAH